MLDTVTEKYPNSFSHKVYEDTENYLDLVSKNYYYFDENIKDLTLVQDSIENTELEKYRELLESRPNEKTELPNILDNL
jgi:predicted P-loop ATPase